jgi:FixJ family two-component response regulator
LQSLFSSSIYLIMASPDATVFIVDDDPAICAALSRLFRLAGLAAQSFGCAQEFLDRAPDLGAGCLILDMCLPDLSGLQIQAELVRIGIGLPIIFLTAHGSESLRAKALQAGAVGFLEKPVQDQTLLTMVSQVLAGEWQAHPAPGFGLPD